MKKTIQSLFALSILFFSVSIQNATAQEGKTKMDAWPEMKAFHEIMAKTFHPAKEGNLAPIKEMSESLAESASNWANSTAPKEMTESAERAKSSLQELANNSILLNKLIKGNGSDDEIMNALGSLHQQFHEIVGLCIKEDEVKPKAATAPTKKIVAPKKTTPSPKK